MDMPSILIKITGVILLIWTLFSIYKHILVKVKTSHTATKGEAQSLSEQALNGLLLYLWLAFMLAFSIGMIVNN